VHARGYCTLNHSPFLGADPDLVGVTHAAAAAGFDCLGIDVFSARAQRDGPDGLAPLVAALAATGIGVEEFAGLNVGDDDDALATELADVLGLVDALAPTWVLVRVTGALDRAQRTRLARCADALTAAGAGVALEPSPFTVVDRLAIGLDVLAGMPGARTGLVVDSWHFVRGDDDWDDLAALDPSTIAYVQFDDGHDGTGVDLQAETMHHRDLPGAGTFPLDRFASVVRAGGFDGPVLVEALTEEWRRRPAVEQVAATAVALQATWPGERIP
jgi:sugar phosphate isomerase/epimerase